MAFDEVTLFEFDLEGAQFGPREMELPERMQAAIDTDSDEDDTEVVVEADEEDESGGGLGRVVLMAVVATVVATLVARRLRGGDEEDGESATIEFEADAEESAEIEA